MSNKKVKNVDSNEPRDLKDQFIEQLEGKQNWEECDPLQKFLLYKYKAKDQNIDCDVSKEAMEVYKNYPYVKELGEDKITVENQNGLKYEMEIEKGGTQQVFRGDTMTSGWWFVQQILAYYTTEEYKKNVKVKINTDTENLKRLSESGLVKIEEIKKYLDIKDEKKREELAASFNNFLKYNHSIGNMILVPCYFNKERTGYNAKWDCWDITLYAIQCWYRENENDTVNLDIVDINKDWWLMKLFSKGGCKEKVVSIITCKKWLTFYFENWNDFIEKNVLQDYCTGNGKDQDYAVKAIIDGKVINEDPKEFFANCCRYKSKDRFRCKPKDCCRCKPKDRFRCKPKDRSRCKPKDKDIDEMIQYMDNFVEITRARGNRLQEICNRELQK